jgi:hypothetical protein
LVLMISLLPLIAGLGRCGLFLLVVLRQRVFLLLTTQHRLAVGLGHLGHISMGTQPCTKMAHPVAVTAAMAMQFSTYPAVSVVECTAVERESKIAKGDRVFSM